MLMFGLRPSQMKPDGGSSNDGSDRTALINEPASGSSISLSEATPHKNLTGCFVPSWKPFAPGTRLERARRGLLPAKFSNSPGPPSGALRKMRGIFSCLKVRLQLPAHIKAEAAHCKF